jgi:hypothetical protein
MHRAQCVADRVLAGVAPRTISSLSLTAGEAAALSASLHDDARDCIYSGALSIAEAIQGLDRALFSWATVKLYYSVFYLARAALGLQGVAVVYSGRTPYTWVATAGQIPSKRSGTSHKVVLDAFAHFRNSSVLLSQQIGAENPFDWLTSKREFANYKQPKFCDPDAPYHFKFIAQHGVRQPVRDYVADDSHLFTFDPDHAMLAFPIATLKVLLSDLKVSNVGRLGQSDANFLASQVFDRAGPLPDLRRLLLS